MDILDEYAIKIGKSPKQLKDDYFSSSEEEQLIFMSHVMNSNGMLMQTGGGAENTQENKMQIIELFSQKTGVPVEEILAELQQMAPEQIELAMQQMIKAIKGGQQGVSMQTGGEQDRGAMIMELIQMYAQAKDLDPTVIVEQFQEMSPEEQQQAIKEMESFLQEQQPQMQMGGEVDEKESWIINMLMKYAQETEQVPEDVLRQFSEMSEEEQTLFLEQIGSGEQMQTGGYDDVSMRGYSDDSPYRYNPYNRIQSNRITMDRTGMDLVGVSDTGDVQYMPAYSGDYEFDGDEVMEYPVYQTFDDGKYDRSLSEKKLNEALARIKNSKLSEYDKERKSEMIKANYRQLLEIDENVAQIQKSKIANPGDQRGLHKKTSQLLGAVFNPYNYSKFSAEDKLKAWSKERKKFIDAIDYISTSPLSAEDLYDKSSTYKPSKNNAFKSVLSGVTSPFSKLAESTGNLFLDDYDPANRGYVFEDIAQPKEVKNRPSVTVSNKTTNNSDGTITVKGKNTRYKLKPFSANNYEDQDGSLWVKDNKGRFIMTDNVNKPAFTNSTPPPSRGGNKGGGKGSGKSKGKETPKTKFPNFDLTFLQKPYYGDPTDADILNDIKSVPGIFDTPATTETQRANMVGMGPEKGNGIQYSPKIDGITPERPKPNPRYKLNTTNQLSSLFNLGKVAQGWAPISPGYYKDVDVKLPELMQYDPRAGLQAIADSYRPILNNLSDTTVGIAAKSSLASKQAEDSLKYVNSIAQQNMQLKNQYQTMMADLDNKVNISRQENAANYFESVQQALANRALIKNQTQAGFEKQYAANQFANASIDNTIMENPYLSDVGDWKDALLGRRNLELDKAKMDKDYLKVQEDKKTQEDLLANVTRLIQQMKDEKAAAKTETTTG